MNKMGVTKKLVKSDKNDTELTQEYQSPDMIVDQHITKLAKEMYDYSVTGLKKLREVYPLRRPKHLDAHEIFYKDMIASSAIFLAETQNWYPPLSQEN